MASCSICYVVCSIFSHIFVGCTITVAFVFRWFSDGFHSTEYIVPYLKLVFSHSSKNVNGLHINTPFQLYI